MKPIRFSNASIALTVATMIGASTPAMADDMFMLPYGSTTPPTVTCSIRSACLIEVAPGDQVSDIGSGDLGLWKIYKGRPAGEKGQITTVWFEPLDKCERADNGKCAGPLKTNLIITTLGTHTYNVTLLEVPETQHTRYGFQFSSAVGKTDNPTNPQYSPAPIPSYLIARAAIEAGLNNAPGLDTNYSIFGNADFRPTKVWNDGNRTYLAVPPSAQAVTFQGEDTLGNWYIPNVHPPIDGVYTIDGMPKHIQLIQDVGKHVPTIDVYRGQRKKK